MHPLICLNFLLNINKSINFLLIEILIVSNKTLRRFRNVHFLALTIFCLVFYNSDAVKAEDGCPPRQLPQNDGQCLPLSRSNKLPLDLNQPMRFEALQQSMTMIWVQATGTITADTPAEFERFLQTYDSQLTRTVFLHSPGGNLLAGLQLGQAIRRAGYNTNIGNTMQLEGLMNIYSGRRAYCLSACAYAFLGGVTRNYRPEDIYGVHRFGTRSGLLNGDDAQVLSGLVAHYVQSMGVDVAMVRIASTASFENDMFRVPVEQARQMRVIFDPTGLTNFVVEQRDGRVVATFRLELHGQLYSGFLGCVDSTPVLTLLDPGDAVPQVLRRTQGFSVQFNGPDGLVLNGRATYIPRTSGSVPTLTFALPDLDVRAFSGDGLSLSEDGLNPSEISELRRGGFVNQLRWYDAIRALGLTIRANNAAQTLPIVLRECSRQATRR